MDNFKELISDYTKKINRSLSNFLESQANSVNYSDNKSPDSLFVPLNYIMSGGGKRIRPLLLLLSCDACGGNVDLALDAAVAIEILHNFTLVHDDIMDNALTRRGKETIHTRWSVNTAILVGDELIGLSYRSILNTKTNKISQIIKTFTDGVIEVCEGQALDNQFEKDDKISLNDYFFMIQKKTAELLSSAAVIGALIANASDKIIDVIRSYSKNLGLAFQIQDDLFDVIANESQFGKKIGGDIIEKKKTYLFLKSLEKSSGDNKENIIKMYFSEKNENKIENIIKIYKQLGVIEDAKNDINLYTRKAGDSLSNKLDYDAISKLLCFADLLLNRGY